MERKKIESLNIIGKRWFQRTYGNSYHSVKIYVNDEILYKGFSYGYGNQYIQTAAEMLESAGYNLDRYYSDGSKMDKYVALYDMIRRTPGFSERVEDVARKKDL